MTFQNLNMPPPSICYPRPISEFLNISLNSSSTVNLFGSLLVVVTLLTVSGSLLWLLPTSSAYYTGWKVAILICRIATAKFEAAMPEHFFLAKSKYSTGSIFMERLRDSSGWRAHFTQCQIGLLFFPLHYFHNFRDGLDVKKSNFFFTNKSVQFLR